MPDKELSIEQRPRPQLLADAPHGMTDAVMHGFSPTLIVGLVGAGYTEAKPRTMKAGGKTFVFMRFVITSAGRRTIGCTA